MAVEPPPFRVRKAAGPAPRDAAGLLNGAHFHGRVKAERAHNYDADSIGFVLAGRDQPFKAPQPRGGIKTSEKKYTGHISGFNQYGVDVDKTEWRSQLRSRGLYARDQLNTHSRTVLQAQERAEYQPPEWLSKYPPATRPESAPAVHYEWRPCVRASYDTTGTAGDTLRYRFSGGICPKEYKFEGPIVHRTKPAKAPAPEPRDVFFSARAAYNLNRNMHNGGYGSHDILRYPAA